jgi:ubiquinone/menaquinone biosynthesis C-methylase UbiE
MLEIYKCEEEFYQQKLVSLDCKRNKHFHKRLVNILSPAENSRVLDLGCGYGASLAPLLEKSKRSITAFDTNTEYLAVAQRVYQSEIAQGRLSIVHQPSDIKILPFEDNTFDYILCQNVIECLPDKKLFIDECYRILKPRGKILMSHHDFDTAIFNSSYKDLTRELVHCFSDTKQAWMDESDGQIGRKLRGIISNSEFKNITVETIAETEDSYNESNYGYNFSQWIKEMADENNNFSSKKIDDWLQDLQILSDENKYYFSICWMYVLATK